MKPHRPKRCAPCASRKSSPAEAIALLKKAEELAPSGKPAQAPGKGVKRVGG